MNEISIVAKYMGDWCRPLKWTQAFLIVATLTLTIRF